MLIKKLMKGGYIMLNRLPTSWKAHYKTTGQRFGMTHGTVTHFVAAMGTTGTIMGTST
jgi:cysteine synthase B